MPQRSLTRRKLAWITGSLAIICLFLPFVYYGAFWYGFVRIRFETYTDDHIYHYFLDFESTTDNQWYSTRPRNFQYEHGVLKDLNSRPEKAVSVDLVNMAIRDGEVTHEITPEWLANWISEVDSPPPALIAECGAIIEVLDKAAQGQLERARHHPYNVIYDQAGWRMTHFALFGLGTPHLIPIAVLLLVISLLLLISSRSVK